MGSALSRAVAVMAVLWGLSSGACAHADPAPQQPPDDRAEDQRWLDVIRRSHVWTRTNVAAMNLKAGPPAAGITPDQGLVCSYLEDEKSTGKSPKFFCSIGPDDKVKIKYGAQNGEIYGEVIATRLLWALGFGADVVHPVKVTCRGCAADPFKNPGKTKSDARFDAAIAERKAPGKEIEIHGHSGWKWPELDHVTDTAGGAPLAQRDALKLLAVFMQHTDTKEEQQRLVCLEGPAEDPPACKRPFMMLNDVGLTFGRANLWNRQGTGSANFKAWSETPVWEQPTGCVGNLDKSFTGTLKNPAISEEGRQFLAGLLAQLSDRQITDLFTASHVDRRRVGSDRPASIADWVAAFKSKRDQIVNRRCGAAAPAA